MDEEPAMACKAKETTDTPNDVPESVEKVETPTNTPEDTLADYPDTPENTLEDYPDTPEDTPKDTPKPADEVEKTTDTSKPAKVEKKAGKTPKPTKVKKVAKFNSPEPSTLEDPETTEEPEPLAEIADIDEDDLTIGTWNVRSLYKAKRLRLLAFLLHDNKCDITALQEIQWIGHGVIKKPRFNFYYSGYDEKHELGTGFIVHEKFKDHVINFKPISPRLSVLRVKSRYYNISLVNCHAPPEHASAKVSNHFYESMKKAYEEIPAKDLKIVLGDFNAIVGRERIYVPHIGMHSLHDHTGINGKRLIDFAKTHSLLLGGTIYPHRKIHKGTWVAPNNTVYQTDHFLIEGKHRLKLLDVRAYRGAVFESDHFLLKAKIRPKLIYIDF